MAESLIMCVRISVTGLRFPLASLLACALPMARSLSRGHGALTGAFQFLCAALHIPPPLLLHYFSMELEIRAAEASWRIAVASAPYSPTQCSLALRSLSSCEKVHGERVSLQIARCAQE